MKNRKREICTSGSVRDEDGQPPHLLGRRNFLHLAAGAAALPAVSRVAWAQTYPTRPVRFILPVVAGGSTDVVARLVAEHLSRVFGQQFIVDNRSGAGGTAGMEAVAKSVPDGYTILVTSDRVASAQHAFKLNFDPIKDLAPICQLVGIHQHVVGEWFQKLAGIKLALVPYRGGGQVINDLIAGHVKIAVLGSTPLLPHYKAGTLRLLAQSSAARSPGLPDVPTFLEAGFNGLVLDQWIGAFAPAGTQKAIIVRLNVEINKVLTVPAVRENLEQQALEPVATSVEEATQLFREDVEKYERLMTELNISAK